MIHPTAVVDPTAELADDCSIGPYTVIGPDVRIGARTQIGAHVVIEGPCSIGEDNHIFQFSSIGAAPQDLKYDNEPTCLEIGDRNRIREFVTLNRGTVGGGGLTKIGNDNLLMAYVHVAHDCHVGNHVIFSNAASLAGHVTVNDHVILGGFTTVHQFCRVGSHSFSGMSSAINRDLPPFVLCNGNHAVSKGINKTGMKRRGFSQACVSAVYRAYMVMVRGRGANPEAVAEVEALAAEFPEVQELLSFVREGDRAIIR